MDEPYLDLIEKAMNISQDIRFATICDMEGEIICSKHRPGTKNLLSFKESLRSLESAARAWKVRNEFSSKIGKGEYVFAEYGKIKRIAIPLDGKNLLYLTTTKKADHTEIINQATKLQLNETEI